MARLSASQVQQLQQAILAAYPDEDELTMMLQFRLGKNLGMIRPRGASYPFAVFKLIERARSEGWDHRLVEALREERPDDPEAAALAAGLTVPVPASSALERMISERNGMLGPVAWRAQLARIETQVCRLRYRTARGSVVRGTAFLVGPSAAITNYHVVEPLIDGMAKPEDVELVFDFKELDEDTINPGVPYALRGDGWLIDESCYSPLDEHPVPGRQPPADRLDYALLRLAGEPGRATVVKEGAATGEERGWIALSSEPPPELDKGALLFIVQYPEDQPIQLAIDTVSDKLDTRVRYLTNTEKGSSGSPCFDINWRLVALHHSGDPNFVGLHRDTYNQGIPIDLVHALITERGHGHHLGAAP